MDIKLFFLSFYFLISSSIMSDGCQTSCGNQEIDFPFLVKTQDYCEYNNCGYPGFDLSCQNRSDTIVTFPSSGNFSVETIFYYDQWIRLRDPDGCLAKRLLQGFDPSGTPFQVMNLQNFTLLNCSYDVPIPTYKTPISCLSSGNNYTVSIPVDRPDLFEIYSSCLKIGTVSLPLLKNVNDWEDRIWLAWNDPDCKMCLRNEGVCYKKGLGVTCSVDLNAADSSNMGKYFALFAALTFVLLMAIVLCVPLVKYCLGKWCCSGNDTEITDGSAIQQHNEEKRGLDRREIEMYPTMLIGESRELPKPDDATCSICLFEYQSKDTLKIIPSCMHYFHDKCIDQWLKRSATCPLCREQ